MQADEIMEMLRRVQAQNTTSTLTLVGLEDYGLGGVDCEICENRGYTIKKGEDGSLITRECKCMAQRRSIRKIRESGMIDMLARYTFANYETPDKEREKIKDCVEAYADGKNGWLYIYGISGSGKTHICTAACVRFIANGTEVYYMSWRDESTALKGLVTDTELYQKKMSKLKTVKVLYIDDFLKGGYTEADIRLAFEIINARYNDTRLMTIISSEMDMKSLINADEALGGRIYERSRGHVIKAPDQNWRLK